MQELLFHESDVYIIMVAISLSIIHCTCTDTFLELLLCVCMGDLHAVFVLILSWNCCCVGVGGLTVQRISVGGSFMVS